MREQIKDVAPYISLFGLFILAGSLLLSTTVGPESPDYLVPALAVLGALLLAMWPLMRPEELRAVLGSRQARFGGNALVLTVAVLGILAILNYLGTLRYFTWDLTENKRFSLSRQTIQILNDLGQPVNLTMVWPANAGPQQVADVQRLVEQYRAEGGDVEFDVIDPTIDLLEFQTLAAAIDEEPNALGRSLVARSGERHAIVYSFDEQALSEAIVKATRDRDLSVWFTAGHGEPQVDQSYSAIRQQLTRDGYAVEVKNLATMTDTLSVEAVQAVVIAGPQQPFTDREVDMLSAYLGDGGAILAMVGPQLPPNDADLNLERLFEPWSISLHDDLVLDLRAMQNIGDAAAPIVSSAELPFHDITSDLRDLNTNAIFPAARSFAVGTPATTTLTTTPIIETWQGAWGETDIAAYQDFIAETQGQASPAGLQGPEDIAGPLTIGLAADGGEDYGRMVVFGSAFFVSDDLFQSALMPLGLFGLNGNIFLNSLNWLTEEEDLISIRATPPDERPMAQPENPFLLTLTTFLLLPLAVIGLGSWIWWRRR